jgi:hypothetical protein
MKLFLSLVATSFLVSVLSVSPANAEDIALSFELPAMEPSEEAQPVPEPAPIPQVDPAEQPLPIPPGATKPPVRYHSASQLPSGVYRRGVAVALNQGATATSLLPPAPPIVNPQPVVVAATPEPEAELPEPKETEQKPELIALTFDQFVPREEEVAEALPPVSANPMQMLFEGGNDSLVAIAVGSAEGTRTPTGGLNPAYYGHTDPGNRAWNMGTFSYQHGASSPEEANRKQLARLQSQSEYLKKRALKYGLNLTLEEMLNGIDLANQSPLAALGRVGYVERLVEAKKNGYEGGKAIVVARTRSYINPDTQRWNAPGLGNTQTSITRDQQRRADAVASAVAAYKQKDPALAAMNWQMVPPPNAEPAVIADNSKESEDQKRDDGILQFWTAEDDPQPDQAQRPATGEPIALEQSAEPDPETESLSEGTLELIAAVPQESDQPSASALLAREGSTASLVNEPSLSLTPTEVEPEPAPTELPTPLSPQPAMAEAGDPIAVEAPAEEPVVIEESSTVTEEGFAGLEEQEPASGAKPLALDTTVFEIPGAMPDTDYHAPIASNSPPLSFPADSPEEEVEAPNFHNSSTSITQKRRQPKKASFPLPAAMLQRLQSQAEADSFQEDMNADPEKEQAVTSFIEMAVPPSVPRG